MNKIFQHYTEFCVCCGETNKGFLTIDHINNDGWFQRKNDETKMIGGIPYFSKIVKEGYPKDLQIMCFNCNFGRARFGGDCPHTDKGLNKVKEKYNYER